MIRYSQNLSSSAGPVGKCARFSPIEPSSRPKRLLPPKALTGMFEGMVHLHGVLMVMLGCAAES